MSKTTIEWTATTLPDGTVLPGYTFNPWWGCQQVSPACDHCYALTFSKRVGFSGKTPEKPLLWGDPHTTPRRPASASYWREPLKWNAEAERTGIRRKVFCASMADVFEEHPDLPHLRAFLWDLIRRTPWLDWLLLTKRPQNLARMVPWRASGQPWPNVWLGTTAESQEWADRRIPRLLEVPAVVHFVSAEPLLGPLDILENGWFYDDEQDPFGASRAVDWVICGGESGPHARPMHPDWARSLRDQCTLAHAPFFFKQWGEWGPRDEIPINARYGEFHGEADWVDSCLCSDGTATLYRVGKHRSGRLLDGREWSEYPRAAVEVPA